MKHMKATCVAVMVGVGLCACSSMGSVGSLANGTSLFQKLGGARNVSSMASDLVNRSIKDPRLASLTSGRNIDPAASSGKVSSQLCSMLGGGCAAPMTDSQIASAASKITPDQSRAISDNFNSSLSRIASNSTVRNQVAKAVGNKIPGVIGGLL